MRKVHFDVDVLAQTKQSKVHITPARTSNDKNEEKLDLEEAQSAKLKIRSEFGEAVSGLKKLSPFVYTCFIINKQNLLCQF